MVDRTNTLRRAQRADVSSPYKRPAPQSSSAPKRETNNNNSSKKGILSVVSNLFSAFWRKAPAPDPEAEADEEDNTSPLAPTHAPEHAPTAPPANPAADALVARGHTLQTDPPPLPGPSLFHPPPPPPPPPQQQQQPTAESSRRSVVSPPSDDRSRKIAAVASYLNKGLERGLNEIEIQGCISLLQGSQDNEPPPNPAPFRFSATVRGSAAAAKAPAPPAAPTAPRMLARNPNGTCVWRGGGSAKPRNRYSSPGFGSSRSAPTLRLSPPDKPKSTPDGKRRRVDGPEPSSSSSAHPRPSGAMTGSASAPEVNNMNVAGPSSSSQSSIPFPNGSARSPPPASAAAAAQQQQQQLAAPRLNVTASAPAVSGPRLRTAGLKPTAPAIPSPLRQAWGQTDSPSPSPPSSQVHSPAKKPTRAANIMTELIKETAPAPKPVFANPYEDASPVPIRPTRKQPLPRRRPAATKPEQQEKKEAEKKGETELSPLKIIEATVPKGAKRSRPPPDLGKQREGVPPAESSSRKNARAKSPELIVTHGTANIGNGNAMIVEEVREDDESPSKKAKMNGLQPAAEITQRERQQQTVEIEEVKEDAVMTSPTEVVLPSQVVEPAAAPFGLVKSTLGMKTSAPKAPSKLRYSFQVDKSQSEEEDAGQARSSVPVATAFPVSVRAPTPRTTEEVKAAVLATPESELPRYTFEFSLSSPGAGPSTQRARAAALAAPVSSLPTFDLSARPPAPAPAPTAVPSIAVSAPVASSSTVAPLSGGFNWAAAGLKIPAKPADSWDCEMCMVNNPASAKTKCISCETPRPAAAAPSTSSAPAPAPAPAPALSGSFNFAAAGFKLPTKPAGSWDCDVCMISNPASAKTKCISCETPRPAAAAAAPSTFSAPTPAPVPAPTGGFNFAAAGFKMPSKPAGSWDCDVCMINNPASAKTKCVSCESPRPAAASSSSSSAAPVPAPAGVAEPAPVMGFNWAAAGMQPPAAPAGWKCSTCMLDNPENVAQCTVCETPR